MVVTPQTESETKRGRGKVSGEATRAIYTANALSFFAKSRTIGEPVVSYEDPKDDSIWQIMFGGSDEG
jgi:hypothetical protein